MNEQLEKQIENILIEMMPIAPIFPTADLQDIDRRARIAAIKKAQKSLVTLFQSQLLIKSTTKLFSPQPEDAAELSKAFTK